VGGGGADRGLGLRRIARRSVSHGYDCNVPYCPIPGEWTGNLTKGSTKPLSFHVSGNGKRVSNLKAYFPYTCVGEPGGFFTANLTTHVPIQVDTGYFDYEFTTHVSGYQNSVSFIFDGYFRGREQHLRTIAKRAFGDEEVRFISNQGNVCSGMFDWRGQVHG
jgi:hypothetical protein